MRAPSPGDVLLTLIRIPKVAELIAEEVAAAFCACTRALCGKVEGGREVWARGEGWLTLDVRGFRGFFGEAGLRGGAGVARGDSCGESRRLMSIIIRVASKVDQAINVLCTAESRGQ